MSRVLRQTAAEPGREMVPASCGSWSKGFPGGSRSSSAPAVPQLCAGGSGGGSPGGQVMLEQTRC